MGSYEIRLLIKNYLQYKMFLLNMENFEVKKMVKEIYNTKCSY